MCFNEKVDGANGFCLYVLRHSGFMENKRCPGGNEEPFQPHSVVIRTAVNRTAIQKGVKTLTASQIRVRLELGQIETGGRTSVGIHQRGSSPLVLRSSLLPVSR